MYHIFLIHSSVNGHQSCFNVLAIVNSAAMYPRIYVRFSITVFSGCMPSSGADGSLVVVQLLSLVQLCNPMDCSMPGFPVLHYLAEFAQTYVRQDSDVIQPSHPLSCPSPPAFILSQHQSLF